jgi:hypothetical protein
MAKAKINAEESWTPEFHHLRDQAVDQLRILIQVLRSDMEELRDARDPAAFTATLQPLAETLSDASRSWSAMADGMARVKKQ